MLSDVRAVTRRRSSRVSGAGLRFSSLTARLGYVALQRPNRAATMDTENQHLRLCRSVGDSRSLWLTSSCDGIGKQALSADGAVNVYAGVCLALPLFSFVSKSTLCAPSERHWASAVCWLGRLVAVELVCRWCCRCCLTEDWLPELLSADFLRQTAATTAWWRRAAASARISAEASSRKGCAMGTTRVS